MHAAGSRAGPIMPAACIVTGYCLDISLIYICAGTSQECTTESRLLDARPSAIDMLTKR